MNRVIVKNGSRVNWETTFENLQDYTQLNNLNYMTAIFETFGVGVNTVSGISDSADTTMQVYDAGSGSLGVHAGIAITSGLYFIEIPETTVLYPVAGTHRLFCKYVGVDSGSTPVVDGFVYASSATTAPTSSLAGYQFVWDIDPQEYGVALADVVSTGSAITSITDIRYLNALKLRDDIYSDNVVRKNNIELQRINGPVSVPSLEVVATSGEQWIEKQTQSNVTFHDMAFADSLNGVVVGDHGTIWRTVDGGTNWNYVSVSGTVSKDVLYGVHGTGNTFLAVGYFGKNYYSTNTGASWTALNASGISAVSEGFYGLCCWVFDNNSFLLGGNSGNTFPGIWKTDDAGATWTAGSNAPVGSNVYDMTFFQNATSTTTAVGVAVGSFGNIYRTTNGGTSWTKITAVGQSLRSVHFPTTSIGYTVGDSGFIYKSTDAGLTWTALTSPTGKALYAVNFYNANVGYICGVNGAIYKTVDGGVTWSLQPAGGLSSWATAVTAFTLNKAIITGWAGAIRLRTDSAKLTLTGSSDGGDYALSGDDVRDLKAWRHQQNTDTGTTSMSFKVNVGQGGTGAVYSATYTPGTAATWWDTTTGLGDAPQINWNNVDRIKVEDSSYAQIPDVPNGDWSMFARATNFNIAIPAYATGVSGIKVGIKKKVGNSNKANISDLFVNLYLNGERIGINKAKLNDWTTTGTWTYYGGEVDTWGRVLTFTDITDPTFGVTISVISPEGVLDGSAEIDAIKMTVYFDMMSYEGTPVALSTELNTATAYLTQELNDHKAGNDHDMHYVTLDTSQEITAQKRFKANVYLTNTNNYIQACNGIAATNYRYFDMVFSNGATTFWQPASNTTWANTTPVKKVLTINGDARTFNIESDYTLQTAGKTVATQDYVNSLVRTGRFVIPLSQYIDLSALAVSGICNIVDHTNKPLWIVPPIPSTLTQVVITDGYEDNVAGWITPVITSTSYTFTNATSAIRVLFPRLVTFTSPGADLALKFQLVGMKTDGGSTQTVIFEKAFAAWQGPPGVMQFSASLMFSI